jgi:hypothetical protein
MGHLLIENENLNIESVTASYLTLVGHKMANSDPIYHLNSLAKLV